jgi:hypothetical protein
METTLLTMAILVVILPTAMLASMFLLKGNSAHSERIAREQEQLDRKNGVAPRTRTVSTNADENKRFDWIKSKLGLNLLFVISGAIALYWGFNTQMRPADVGNWSYEKWLPLLIIWAIGATLIALNAKEKTAATLQTVLTGVMLILLIALPLWSWMVTPSASPQRATHSEVPLASSPQSSWPKWVIPPGGESERNTSPPGMHLVAAGDHFLLRAVYPDGHKCSFGQSCPNASEIINYATNEAKETNTVHYAFAPN